MISPCEQCKGSGKDPYSTASKASRCPDCGGTGESSANKNMLIRQYATITDSKPTGHLPTQFLFSTFIGLSCFLFSQKVAEIDTLQSSFNALLMALTGFVISFACPMFLGLCRWFIAICVLVICSYLCIPQFFQ